MSTYICMSWLTDHDWPRLLVKSWASSINLEVDKTWVNTSVIDNYSNKI